MPHVRVPLIIGLLLPVALSACKTKSDQASSEPAASAKADLEPRLASRYGTPWGELGWKRRVHDTITFANHDDTIFLHCTVRPTPVVHCRWSKSVENAPGQWHRGLAKLTAHPDHSLTGTWGHDDSDRDGGPFNMKPAP